MRGKQWETSCGTKLSKEDSPAPHDPSSQRQPGVPLLLKKTYPRRHRRRRRAARPAASRGRRARSAPCRPGRSASPDAARVPPRSRMYVPATKSKSRTQTSARRERHPTWPGHPRGGGCPPLGISAVPLTPMDGRPTRRGGAFHPDCGFWSRTGRSWWCWWGRCAAGYPRKGCRRWRR